MAWQRSNPFYFDVPKPHSKSGSFGINANCFIRKQHNCDKIFGASKSCFIACPTQDELEPILGLMAEKLAKFGVEPIIAVKDRAYGQDIFCTKICGRIIESRFCIVILDDAVSRTQNIPNPNVYYEYGLMTSLRKHIIPLQKDGLQLAFNIQSHDTIKYTAKNIAEELDRAIRDAISITESPERAPSQTFLSDKAILRRLEMAGFDQKGDDWVLANAIADTGFHGFGQYDKSFYLYLGKIDTEADFAPYLDDLVVAVYRTEKKANELQTEVVELKKQISANKKALETPLVKPSLSASLHERRLPEAIAAAKRKIDDRAEKLNLMRTIYVGFIVNPDVDAKVFLEKAKATLLPHSRYNLTTNEADSIAMDDIKILLADQGH